MNPEPNTAEDAGEPSAHKEPAIGLDEFKQTASLLTTPIDYAGLIQAGIIEKIGPWYKVNDWEGLPEHARAQISNWQSGAGMLVKFRKPTKKLNGLSRQA